MTVATQGNCNHMHHPLCMPLAAASPHPAGSFTIKSACLSFYTQQAHAIASSVPFVCRYRHKCMTCPGPRSLTSMKCKTFR